jgi:hypothetical protein
MDHSGTPVTSPAQKGSVEAKFDATSTSISESVPTVTAIQSAAKGT